MHATVSPPSAGQTKFRMHPAFPVNHQVKLTSVGIHIHHHERHHQGLPNVIPFPEPRPAHDREGPVECHERLDGTLKFYRQRAA